MTTYTNYDEIYAQLNGSWNVGVIAKPTFKNGNIRMDMTHSTVFITMWGADASPITTGSNSRDQIITRWQIRAVAESKANADKYLGEIRRIINAYNLTNGHWHVNSWKLYPTGKLFYYQIECDEVLNDLA